MHMRPNPASHASPCEHREHVLSCPAALPACLQVALQLQQLADSGWLPQVRAGLAAGPPSLSPCTCRMRTARMGALLLATPARPAARRAAHQMLPPTLPAPPLLLLAPQVVVCSNARRTRQTLDEMAAAWPALAEADAHFLGSLYTTAALDGQTRGHLSEIVAAEAAPDHACCLCLGHNKARGAGARVGAGAKAGVCKGRRCWQAAAQLGGRGLAGAGCRRCLCWWRRRMLPPPLCQPDMAGSPAACRAGRKQLPRSR